MINSLYIGRSGLDAAKYSVDVTSNNIANENTAGYVKRTINTSELTTLEDDIGNGVSFDSVTRSTSVYLYDKLVSQDSLSSYYEAEDSILSNVEMMFSETENTGFSSTLSNFLDSLETLRGDSTNLIYKNDFSSQAGFIVEGIQSLNENLNETISSTKTQLEDDVKTVNNILEQIVSLNEQILKSNTESVDLLDKRDLLEKKLSEYVDVQVNRSSNTYNLKLSGVNVIFNNTNLHEISIKEENIAQKDIYNSSDFDTVDFSTGDKISIVLNNTSTKLTIDSAIVGKTAKEQIMDKINASSEFANFTASLDTSNNLIITSDIEGEEGKFDIAISLNGTEILKNSNSVEAENNVSLAVYNNELALSGGSLKALTEELTSSTSNIYEYKNSLDDFAQAFVDTVNSNSATPLFYGSSVDSLSFISDNVNSLTNDDLENLAQIQWNDDITIGNETTSFVDFYKSLLVTISSNVEDNSFKLESQNAVVNSLETTYNNLTKVDPDTEMINLLQYQAAYEANAKVISTVDEMLQTLLNM
ncbi:flagellar hook-associated protein FlgK [Arcobacter sp. s6]|uniref:flagellar hook-associated protein FlgK n=1 Tax=Arcobacter sp. s6 TaxID=3230363 RepID=UPI00349FFF11